MLVIDRRPHWCVSCLRWCPGHDAEGFCTIGREPVRAVQPVALTVVTGPAAPVAPVELVQCVTCQTRTLPRIAAAEWPLGVCECCRMTQRERRELAAAIRRGVEHGQELDRRRAGERRAA